MMRILFLLVIFALARIAAAQTPFGLGLHESARVMGMGGAFVAVADDPQAGLLNPAGLSLVQQIGNESLTWLVPEVGQINRARR